MSNIILAIDPGTYESGWVFVDEDLNILGFGKSENKYVERLVRDTVPLHMVVIERIVLHGDAGNTTALTCEEVGRLSVLADLREVPVAYIKRSEEKSNLVKGEKKKNDTSIRRALIRRFARFDMKNGKGTREKKDVFYGFHNDVWQAYAVAVTWHDLYFNKEEGLKIARL